MIKYNCERCGKIFPQKSRYESHKRRKTPCKSNVESEEVEVEEYKLQKPFLK